VFYEEGCDAVCELVRQVFVMNGCSTETIATGVSRKGFELS
jgi:hypothetical protein